MIRDLGIVRPGTLLYIPFHTFDSNDPSASVTLTGLATSDIEIYKDGSTTQRGSDNGYALLDTDGIDFDGITGIHGLSIDLADNTTAGFYASGSQYWVVVSSITVDAATVNFVLCTFRIGYPSALLNTTIATLSSQTSFTLTAGPAEDDALNGMWAVIHDVASAVQFAKVLISDYTGSTKTVTLAAGATFTAAASDNFHLMDLAPLQPATVGRSLVVDAAGLADANAVKVGPSGSGTAQTARDLGAYLTLVREITDRFYAMLEPAPGSPNEFRFSADALQRVQTVLGVNGAHVDASFTSVLARLPAALIGGRIDATVGAMQADVLTSSALAASAVTEIQTGLPTAATVALVKEVTDRLATMLTAASGSPGEFKFTPDAVQAVQSVLGVGAANVDAQLAAILTAVGTRLAAASYTVPDNAGIAAAKQVTDRLATMLTAAAGSPGEFRFTADAIQQVQAVLGVAAANLDAQIASLSSAVGTRASQASVDAVAGFVDTEVADIRATTDKLATLLQPAGGSPGDYEFSADALRRAPTGSGGGSGLTQADVRSAVGLASANLDTQLAGLSTLSTAVKVVTDRLGTMLEVAPGSPGESRFTADAVQRVQTVLGVAAANLDAQLAALPAVVADAVWEESIAAHSGTSGSTAEALNAAGSAGDPWTTALPGSYAPGQAGYIVGAIKTVSDQLATMLMPAPGSPGEYRLAPDALQAVVQVLGMAAGDIDAQIAAVLAAINTRLASSSYTAPDNTGIARVKEITDRVATMLTAAPGSPNEFKFTADAIQAVQAVLGVDGAHVDASFAAVLARLPAALVGGRIDASVGAMQADTMTAAALASDAVAEIQSGLATSTVLNFVREVTDRLATMMTAATGSPGEFAFTADALRFAPAGSGGGGGLTEADVRDAVGLASANLDTQLAALSALGTAIRAVTDRLATMLTAASGSPGEFKFTADAVQAVQTILGVAAANLDAQLAATAAAVATRASQTSVDAVKAKTDNLPSDPADASDIAAAFATVNGTLATIDGRIDTEVPAIKQVTDKLHSMLEAATGSPGESRFTADSLRNAPAGSGGGGSGPTAAEIVDAILDEALAGHVTAGSVGEAISTAGLFAVRGLTLLQPAGGSPGDWALSPDALRAVIGIVPTAVENADALLTRDMSAVDDSAGPARRMPIDALRHIRNRFSTTVVPGYDVVFKEDDTTEAWRQALTTDPAAEPITGTDPT